MGWEVGRWHQGRVGLVRRAAKIDSNHADVVAGFRKLGYLVLSLAAHGRGVPDLLIYRRDVGFRLIEVKRDKKASLTADQVAFQAQGWPVEVVTDATH